LLKGPSRIPGRGRTAWRPRWAARWSENPRSRPGTPLTTATPSRNPGRVLPPLPGRLSRGRGQCLPPTSRASHPEQVHLPHPALERRHLAWISSRAPALPPWAFVAIGAPGPRASRARRNRAWLHAEGPMASLLVGWGHSVLGSGAANPQHGPAKKFSSTVSPGVSRRKGRRWPATDTFILAAKCLVYLGGWGSVLPEDAGNSLPRCDGGVLRSLLASWKAHGMAPFRPWGPPRTIFGRPSSGALYEPPEYHASKCPLTLRIDHVAGPLVRHPLPERAHLPGAPTVEARSHYDHDVSRLGQAAAEFHEKMGPPGPEGPGGLDVRTGHPPSPQSFRRCPDGTSPPRMRLGSPLPSSSQPLSPG